MGMGNKLVDTPLEDVAMPDFVLEQSKLDETIRILRGRGQHELADMLAVHVDEAEGRVNECV